MLINGLIKKVDETTTDKGRTLNISGVSFNEITTNGLSFATETNVDVMQFLSSLINSTGLRNGNFKVTANLPTTKRDGSSFPKLLGGETIQEFDKSLGSLLDKYLQDEYTKDGRYIWYVNNDKELVAVPREGGVTTASLIEGEDFKVSNYKTNSDDVRNFIIVKCGLDAKNNPTTANADDPVSRAKLGFKFHFIIDNSITNKLILKERDTNPADFPNGSKLPSSFPYTTVWGVTIPDTGDLDDDQDAYNESLRVQAKDDGRKIGLDFIAANSKGFKEITISMPPNVDYDLADKILITSDSYNLTNIEMRISQINWSISGVDIILKEEVASI
ncbi:MAG: hypothetical protein DRI61_17425 [Chloroflexi bacterium]|nr:MAG: hypothetical protein DRI61_17425 [Chloroflexota bacterium]